MKSQAMMTELTHKIGGEYLSHGRDAVLDLLLRRHTLRLISRVFQCERQRAYWRMNVVDTGTDLIGITVRFEDVEQLEVSLGRLDRDD